MCVVPGLSPQGGWEWGALFWRLKWGFQGSTVTSRAQGQLFSSELQKGKEKEREKRRKEGGWEGGIEKEKKMRQGKEERNKQVPKGRWVWLQEYSKSRCSNLGNGEKSFLSNTAQARECPGGSSHGTKIEVMTWSC